MLRPGALLALGLLALAVEAGAQQVVGTGTAGSCTEAVFNARFAAALAAPAGPNRTVTFNCGGGPVTIPFTATKSVSSSVTIDGAGQQITLDGQDAVRLFITTYQFTPGLTFQLANLTLRRGRAADYGGAVRLVWQEPARWATFNANNVVFEDNVAVLNDADSGGGGAIFAQHTAMNISNSVFRRNRGGIGGGLAQIGAAFTITDTRFENNSTHPQVNGSGNGGAIYIDGSEYTTLTLRRVVFTNNVASNIGGAIHTWMYGLPSGMVVEDSTFANNTCVTNGGGIFHMNGSLSISGSTFSGNTTAGQGGGLWVLRDAGRPNDTPVTVTNSTFVGNRATTVCDGCYSVGGGIANSGATSFTLSHVTVTGNFAGWTGGGIASGATGTSVRASVIANNTAADGGHTWNIGHNCTGTMNNAGGNVQWPTLHPTDSNDRPCSGGITFVNPQLGTLGDYGGPTQTIPPLPGSPLINAIGSGCPPPSTDQRGIARPQGAGCDIGAHEWRPAADLALTKTALGTAGEGLSLSWRIVASNPGPQAASGVTVTDTFTAPMSGVTWTCAGSGGATCPASGSGNLNATVNLPAGGAATFTATGTVSGLGAARQVSNTAALVLPPGTDDPNPANNTAGASAQVLATLHYHPVTPCRVLDTRGATGPSGGPALAANQPRTFTVAGTCGVPATAWAVVANLTATAASSAGHIRLYPAGTPAPNASAVNFVAARARANNATLALSASGQLTAMAVLPSGTTHFIVDVFGYYE
ncbi:MAG TPA: choice-of-anchor Q domain-containing protein [Vicinamibacteria bacterium]